MYCQKITKFTVIFGVLLFFAGAVFSQEISVPRGIILGLNYNKETKELDSVFTNQSELNFGTENTLTIHIWTEIRNAAGKDITWFVEYSNGLREEILTQNIKYDRYRTYIEKTFRKKILDPASKQYVDTAGPCKIQLVDKQNNNTVIAEKVVTIK